MERDTGMEPVFIVAQYKSGTSWLLAALSAHPDVIGLREIDIVRVAYEVEGRRVRPASAEHRLEQLFGKSAWCRRDVRADLADGVHAEPGTLQLGRPQSYEDLTPEAAVGLYEAVASAAHPHEVMDAFLAAAERRGAAARLVLKAADQVWVFDALQEWRPDAKKIAITRDGRDAAISAEHYRRLMAAEAAPWYGGSADYLTLLGNWASRAQLIADLGRARQLYVVRYEDLTRDFAGTLGPLLRWLGLDADAETIDAIDAKTSFEARTGRERGSEGSGVIRKGAVGEWIEALDDAAKATAWEIAGEQLAALGYTEDGSVTPLPAQVAPPPA